MVFVYAAMLAGLAGWLYAHFQRSVSPKSVRHQCRHRISVDGGARRRRPGLRRHSRCGRHHRASRSAAEPAAMADRERRRFRDGGVRRGSGAGPANRLQRDMADPVRPSAASVAANAGRPSAPAGSATAASGDTSAAGAGGPQGVRRTGRRQRCQLRGRQRARSSADRPNGAGRAPPSTSSPACPLSAGRIASEGHPLRAQTPQRAATLGLGRTFQHVEIVADMSVIENVALGARMRGHAGCYARSSSSTAPKRALLVAPMRNASSIASASPTSLQAGRHAALGQLRLVEVARALCLNPVLSAGRARGWTPRRREEGTGTPAARSPHQGISVLRSSTTPGISS